MRSASIRSWPTKLDTAAQAIVDQARTNGKLVALAPCAKSDAAGGEACAKTFIESFGAKAYRRPLTGDETAGLLKAYHVGADGYTYADGIDLVTRVLLQSPGLLYTTEIGAPGVGGRKRVRDDLRRDRDLAFLLAHGRAAGCHTARYRRFWFARHGRRARNRSAALAYDAGGAIGSCAWFENGSGSTTLRVAKSRRACIPISRT